MTKILSKGDTVTITGNHMFTIKDYNDEYVKITKRDIIPVTISYDKFDFANIVTKNISTEKGS